MCDSTRSVNDDQMSTEGKGLPARGTRGDEDQCNSAFVRGECRANRSLSAANPICSSDEQWQYQALPTSAYPVDGETNFRSTANRTNDFAFEWNDDFFSLVLKGIKLLINTHAAFASLLRYCSKAQATLSLIATSSRQTPAERKRI